MTLKSDPIFEEKLIFCLKNHTKNLVNFNLSSGKSENSDFYGLLLSKVCNVWAEKIQANCVVKNDVWFQKWHKEFDKFFHKKLEVTLNKSFVYNILAEEMQFWTKVAHRISTFWPFYFLSEVAKIPHVIFETRSQFLYKLCTILW